MKKLTACSVCQKTDMTTYTKCDDHMMSQETFTLTKCTNCGLIATNPRPLEKELGRYYEFEDYISHSETNKGLINRWYRIIKRLNTNKKSKHTRQRKRAPIRNWFWCWISTKQMQREGLG